MSLYENIRKRRASVKPMRKKGQQGAPTDQDFRNAAKTAKKKPKKNTIACKFILSLKELAHTLGATNPHYVRCVKPNDVHMRPCDGAIAFDAAKTYRQLLYAGVMEVVKIKNEGYPFREKIEEFWKERCVKNGYHKILKLEEYTNLN